MGRGQGRAGERRAAVVLLLLVVEVWRAGDGRLDWGMPGGKEGWGGRANGGNGHGHEVS